MLFKDIIKKQGNCMDTSINILNFIREITDSDEEFLAVIEEMNRWTIKHTEESENEESEQRFIHVPYIPRGLDFTRDEHREALDIASKTIQNTQSNKYYRSNIAQHRACKSASPATCF